MNGVTIDATRAMLLMPPMITSPSSTARPMPETSGGSWKELASAPDMPLDCTVGRKVP